MKCLSIDEIKEKIDSKFILISELPFENAQLSDATGRTIQTFNLHAGVNEIRFPSLQSGTYFIRMGEQCVKWVVE